MPPSHRDAPSLLAYCRAFGRRYALYLACTVLISCLGATFNIAVDYQIKEIIDAISAASNATHLHTLLAFFIVYKILNHGVFFIQRLLDIRYRPRMLVEVMTELYEKTVHHSLHWFDNHLSGEVTTKIADFQNNLSIVITSCARCIQKVFTVLVIIAFLTTVHGLSTLIIVGFVLIYTPVIFFLLRRQMHLQEQYARARQASVGIVNDSITNIFGVKIIGSVASEFALKLRPALESWRFWDRKTRVFDAWFVDNADTLMITIMSAVQILVLTHLYTTGEITAGGFAFVGMMTLKIHSELDQFLDKLLFEVNPAIAALRSSYAFIHTPYDTTDRPDAKPIGPITGQVAFERVTFAYGANQAPIFKDFSLDIGPGERLGIVGMSGAGKTTLVKCLLRYFDIQGGTIRLDGHDITTVTQESLRANLSVIPQDITMFHRTILENLQLAKPSASREEIEDACRRAKIHDDILAMEKGYASIVGERGVKLSGGQRQRVAIARAILKNAPLLILDEATSALDTPTEQLIQTSLEDILDTSQATVIAIAHRLSTLKHMDRIIVLEKGQIIEEGSHEGLLAQNGAYKKLWRMQLA